MDSDIVLFNTDTPNGVDYPSTFQGKNSYTEDASFDYKEQLKHWRNELDNFLKTGNILFLLLSKKEEFFKKTGEKQHSGTGRNRQTTNIVNLHNNYEFLPVNIGRITAATGKHIEFTGNTIFNEFFFGNNFIDCLLSINQQLAQESKKKTLPEWATQKQFSTKKELETNKQKTIDKNTKEIEKIKLRNKKLQVELEKEQALKDLLFEQGKPLENAVIESLKNLGCKAENYDD